MIYFQLIIEKRSPDVLTLPKTFNDLSVSRNLFSKTKMRQFGACENQRVKSTFESVMRAVWRSAQRILHRARRRVKTPSPLDYPPPIRNRRKTKIRTNGSTLEISHQPVYSTPVAWRQGKELKNCI